MDDVTDSDSAAYALSPQGASVASARQLIDEKTLCWVGQLNVGVLSAVDTSIGYIAFGKSFLRVIKNQL